MPEYDVGKLIKKLREQKGLTQEELADGILDRTSISRLENGTQIPHKSTLDALFERLGFCPQNNINYYMDKNTFDVYQKKSKLDGLLRVGKTDEADKMIETLEADKRFCTKLERQFLLSARAASLLYKKSHLEDVYPILLEAIKLSIPKFDEQNIQKYYITNQEYRIINMISIVYYENNDNPKSTEILYQVKKSFDNCSIDEDMKANIYPNLIYNLTKSLIDMEKYKEAISLCIDGIDICIKNNKLIILPLIVLNKALCLIELGDKISGKKYLLQAYYSCDMVEKYGTMEKIRNYVKNNLDKIDIVFD